MSGVVGSSLRSYTKLDHHTMQLLPQRPGKHSTLKIVFKQLLSPLSLLPIFSGWQGKHLLCQAGVRTRSMKLECILPGLPILDTLFAVMSTGMVPTKFEKVLWLLVFELDEFLRYSAVRLERLVVMGEALSTQDGVRPSPEGRSPLTPRLRGLSGLYSSPLPTAVGDSVKWEYGHDNNHLLEDTFAARGQTTTWILKGLGADALNGTGTL